ncbi:putative chalcone synthase [Dioscorea sansibarensis]
MQVGDEFVIKKRYMHLTEDTPKKNPSLCASMAPSLHLRQEMAITQVPTPAKQASLQAIKEWGLPKTSITYLIFCATTSGIDMPGADYRLAKLLPPA